LALRRGDVDNGIFNRDGRLGHESSKFLRSYGRDYGNAGGHRQLTHGAVRH
jgi:hypothetical protein